MGLSMLRWLGVWVAILLLSGVRAQEDGLNLPAELYILLNSGQVQRYGLGASGVSTVSPPDTFVVDFGISPDGNWLAYRSEDGLYTTYMPDPDPILLEGSDADIPPIRGYGDTLSWSPDGGTIAYTTPFGARVAFNINDTPVFDTIPASPLLSLIWSPDGTYLAAEAENNIWWIYRRDGTTMVLTSAIPSSYGVSWWSETELVFAPEDGGLLLMDLTNANAQSTLLSAGTRYRLPQSTGSRSLVAFAQSPEEPNSGFYQQYSLTGDNLVALQTAETLVDLTRSRWSPDGSLVVSLRGGVLVLVRPLTGTGFPLPVANAVTYSWGPGYPFASNRVDLNTDAYFIAPVAGVEQLWRLSGGPAEPLTTAETDVTAYAVSPSVVAYSSASAIRVIDASGETTVVAEVETDNMALSPDGSRLAFTDSDGIKLLDLATGDITPLIDGYQKPRFASNINALLVENATGLALLDPTTGAVIELGAFDQARWLADGRVLAHTADMLVVIDPAQEPPSPRTLLRVEEGAILSAGGDGPVRVVIGSTDRIGGSRVQLVETALDGGSPQLLESPGYMVQTVVSPDGTSIAGLTRINGALLFYTIDSALLTLLTAPADINDFRWATFR